MSQITLEVPENIWKNLKTNMTIQELFSNFWIDFEFVLEERKYANNFSDDLKNNNFIINNTF
jgi:hypothetical protein